MEAAPNEHLQHLLDYLRRARAFDFSTYKAASLQRRIDQRLRVVGVADYTDYVDYLEVHPDEFRQLFNTILINVTDFFRDTPAWDAISSTVLPQVLAQKEPFAPIRVWSAGCSSGQEAYSVAMLLAEATGEARFKQQVKIYATDIDEDALSQARQASYTTSELSGVPDGLRNKYLDGSNGRYTFKKDLRRVVIFGRHDLLQDAPISRVDLLICRNTLMYFNSEGQARILPRFEFAVNDGGFLFLGKAEVLLGRGSAFVAVDARRRIFAKQPRQQMREQVLPAEEASAAPTLEPSLGSLLRDQALEIDPAAQLVLGLDSRLVLANAEARQMFSLHANVIGRRLSELPALALPLEARYAVEQALSERRALALKEVPAVRPGGEPCFLDVLASPLETNSGQMQGLKVVFTDVTHARHLREELERSRAEIEAANEKLQSSNEELATTNEELQSTMEELETTNEELQSTNEELETMNEELQSTIEELETVNTELQQRGAELKRLNVYLESIMSSLRDAVVVLDLDLTVRSWNQRAEDLWGLRADEARGKPFLGLDFGLPVDKLLPVIRASLAGAGKRRDQTVTLAASNRKGRPVTVQVTAAALMDGAAGVQGAILVMEEKQTEPR